MIKGIPFRVLLLASLVWGLSSLSLPAVPGTITNKEGRSFEGELKVLDADTIRLDLEAGQGSVSYVFRKEGIASLEFQDAEFVEDGLDAYSQQQYETSISLLQDIHRERSAFYKLWPDPRLAEPSLALGDAYLKTERFLDAAAVAGVLLGANYETVRIVEQANEMLLLAFFGLGRFDETEVLATRWCESREPFGESALGWWILAEIHLARGHLEKARWAGLQPITFSSQYPKQYLQDCYHAVIAAWIGESPEQALRLFDRYQDRGYVWPEETHPETRVKLSSLNLLAKESDGEEEGKDPLALENAVPKKDLNLPLKKVRKLTIKSPTTEAHP